MSVTAVILTLNEEKHIVKCIESLLWVDQVLVFDSFSQDQTCELARQAGARIVQHEFENYAQQRNAALAEISTEWVFFVDADERSTPQLAAEIQEVMANRPEKGWAVPRHNFIFGKLTLGAGWFPDYQMRLFVTKAVHYEREVHELAVVDGEIGQLVQPLIHHNYRNPAHFHQKQRQYTLYDAKILQQKGIQPKIYTPFTQPLRHFWWRFITLKGYRDGLHGLRLSVLMGYYEWVKYRLIND